MAKASGLHWEAAGPVYAPVVVLASGLGGSAGYWKPNLPALTERFRVLSYDQRGTGRSTRAFPPEVTVADFADDIVTVMDEAGVDRASLIGHALGAVAGLALALKAPERLDKLVLINGWARPDPHFARCFDARLALLRGSGARAYVQAQPIFLYPADWSSAHSAEIDAEEDAHVATFPSAATVEARIAALRAFDIADMLGEIGSPTLVLSAADDLLVPPSCSDVLANGLPNAVARRMAWGGHACNVTDPETFNTHVLTFLES